MTGRYWLAWGALLAGLGVVSGAFGAHGLKHFLETSRGLTGDALARAHDVYETAVRYQMYHALAVIAVGLAGSRAPSNWLNAAGCCFTLGTAMFSGWLYAGVFLGPLPLPYVVPLGGLVLIVAWLLLAVGALRG